MRKVLSAVAGALLVAIAHPGFASSENGLGEKSSAIRDARPQITPEQRDRLATKLRMIEQIVRAAEPDMQVQQTSAESRRWLIEKLYAMPLEQIKAIGVPGSFGATSNAISKAGHVKALGDAASDLVYRPITPCRFIDTRNVGGQIVTSRTFDLDAIGSTYGGSASCNIVTAAGVVNADDFAAVAINVAIVSPSNAPGFIGARPPGSTNTTALVNWYQSGAQVQASNAGVIPTLQGTGDEIEFFGSPTQIIVDVFGVFTRPDATALDCVRTLDTSQTIPTGFSALLLSTQACATGYTMTGGGCASLTSGEAVYLLKVELSAGNAIRCAYNNLSGSAQTAYMETRCCRTPGR